MLPFSIRPKRAARRSRFHHPQSSRQSRPLRLERLEDRLVLSIVTWDGGGGNYDWNTPANWSGDVLPSAADDVTIDFGANDFTVVHSGSSTNIHSLTSRANLSVTGGE